MQVASTPLLAAGFAVFIAGPDPLVREASSTARRLHASERVIELTAAAFGASRPDAFRRSDGRFQGKCRYRQHVFLGDSSLIDLLSAAPSLAWREISFSLPAALAAEVLSYMESQERMAV